MRRINVAIEKLECANGVLVGGVPAIKNAVNGLVAANNTINRGVVIFGDSITSNNSSSIQSLDSNYNVGYFIVANTLMGSPFDLIQNAGVGGDTTSDMLSRVQTDVIDLNPEICIILGGTNDLLASRAVQLISDDLKVIYEQILKSGITPVICTVPSSSGMGSEQSWNELNQFIINYAYDNNIIIADFASSITDVNVATFPYHVSQATKDGTHPSKIGALLMGRDLALALSVLKTSNYTPPSSNNNSSNLISNTLFTGSAGTSAGNVSGTIPDSWGVSDLTSDINTSIVASVINKGSYNSLSIIQSNTGSLATTTDIFQVITSGVVSGLVVNPYIELNIDAINFEKLEVSISVRDVSNVTLFTSRFFQNNDNVIVPSYEFDGKIKIPSFELPTGSDDILIEIYVTMKEGVLLISKPALMI